MTKRFIGREHESRSYILDPMLPRYVACSGVTTPFEIHCRLGHPSMPLLKKLCLSFLACLRWIVSLVYFQNIIVLVLVLDSIN